MMAVAIIAAEEVAETVVAGQLLVVKATKWLQASGIIGYNYDAYYNIDKFI